MLSRTADSLFWMSRYIERAESTARMLDVTFQVSLLPQSPRLRSQGWHSLLASTELRQQFDARFDALNGRNVLEFMTRDADNPASIYSCLRAARECARAVRGSLTTEVWETCNITWLELQRRLPGLALHADPREFFDWVKFRSHLSRGVVAGTMLRDEALAFLGLGAHLERADNTARLLDVAFIDTGDEAQASAEAGDTSLDFYRWSALLHSVSGFETYRKVYRDVLTPARVAELLIFHPGMPRSLRCTMDDVIRCLEDVATERSIETLRRARVIRAGIETGAVQGLLERGMHGFLTDFLDRVADLGNRISQDFLVPLSD